MTILAVNVMRTRHGVIHVPRHVVSQLPDGSNVISIEDIEDERPDLSRHRSYKMISNLYGIVQNKEEKITLDEFVRSCNGENIIVHCEQGMIRSRRIANILIEAFPKYTMMNMLRLNDGKFMHFPNVQTRSL